MSLANFNYMGNSVTFTRSPGRPERSLTIIQPQRQSGGGEVFGYAQTIVADIINLPLRLDYAQKVALLAFFNTTVNGMANTFVYTDTAGVPLTVRFAAPRLDNLAEVGYQSWTVTVPLRVVA